MVDLAPFPLPVQMAASDAVLTGARVAAAAVSAARACIVLADVPACVEASLERAGFGCARGSTAPLWAWEGARRG